MDTGSSNSTSREQERQERQERQESKDGLSQAVRPPSSSATMSRTLGHGAACGPKRGMPFACSTELGGRIVALEHRNGRVYYYESRRIGRAVVRRYVGAGRIAELVARLDESRRADEAATKLGRDEARTRRRRGTARLRRWLAGIDAAVAAELEAEGWHRHKRQWRRKRGAAFVGPGDAGGAEARRTVPIDANAFLSGKPVRGRFVGGIGWPTPPCAGSNCGPAYARPPDGPRGGGRRACGAGWRGRTRRPRPLVAERVVLGRVLLDWCETRSERLPDGASASRHGFHRGRIGLARAAT